MTSTKRLFAAFLLTATFVGCGDGETTGAGGVGGGDGAGGLGGAGGGDVFPCTEQGIRDAIAEGGGPHTFTCEGPTTVTTGAVINISNDVILDGEGNLTVDGDDDHLVFGVNRGVTAELIGLTMTRGRYAVGPPEWRLGGGCIANDGTLTLTNCTVTRCSADESAINGFGSSGGGISSRGTLTLTNSTVSENSAYDWGGGIFSSGTATLVNSTVSGNTNGGIWSRWSRGTMTITNSTVSGNTNGGVRNSGTMTITNSTVSGNTGVDVEQSGGDSLLTLTNSTVSGSVLVRHTVRWPGFLVSTVVTIATLIDGACAREGDGVIWTSNGYNIESPGATCGFDQETDQVDVTEGELNLGPLADNGGPTQTHGFVPGSVAMDAIPRKMCEVTKDQRGISRRQGARCDVGAYELEQ